MKPLVLITHRVHADAVELLLTVCDVAFVNTRGIDGQQQFRNLARNASGLLAATPERVDATLLAGCQRLRVLACAFRIPEHIDIAACTQRGIWVTNVMSHRLDKEAEIEAARNVLDVISGDTPRGALNDMFPHAA